MVGMSRGHESSRVSVVTPTLRRPNEVRGLVANLHESDVRPSELILVDGAPPGEDETEVVVGELSEGTSFPIRYLRAGGGTAIQRNVGIDAATGEYIAFVDDDVRLAPDFLSRILGAFATDSQARVAAISGCLTNQRLDADASRRWRWYRRLRVFTTWEPGAYDYQSGYPINRYLQPAYTGLRDVDFISSNSAVWRRSVLDTGLRFDEFFRDFGVLEDAHLALRARRTWRICEAGGAHAIHLDSPRGREQARLVAWKTAVNYRFVFVDIVPERSWQNEARFWRVQLVDLLALTAAFVRHPSRRRWDWVAGKARGIVAATSIKSAESGRRLLDHERRRRARSLSSR